MIGLNSVMIDSLSCNNTIAIFVSKDGVLYSLGDDLKTRTGILGLGNNYYQSSPSPIKSLFNNRMTQVSISNTQASALDHSGKIFLWGTGDGLQRNSNVPLQFKSEKVINGKQIIAASNAIIIVTGKLIHELRWWVCLH